MDFKRRRWRYTERRAGWFTRFRRRPALAALAVMVSGLLALAMTGGKPGGTTEVELDVTNIPIPELRAAGGDPAPDPEPRVAGRASMPDPARQELARLRWEPSPLLEPLVPFFPGDSLHARIAAMEAATPEPPDPLADFETVTVRSGDSLSAIFSRMGLSAQELHRVVHAGDETRALSRIHPGREMHFRLLDDGEGLAELRYPLDRTRTLIVEREEEGFRAAIHEQTLETRRLQATGTIDRSLYLAGRQAGLSNRHIMQLMSIFEWQLDFNRDVRSGDRFSVIYEADFLDGERVADGRIIAASFENRGRTFQALHFELPDGTQGYFTPEGENLRKAFIRRPVQNARISSGFNRNRKHPVLGVTRPHLGTDFAAPTGTPIMASGAGRVVHAGRKGGYGHTVIIQHSNQYRTLYAHMSRYADGIRVGSRVDQGQVIGYVGRSGLATGPHLHYEFHVNGQPRDAMRVELPNGDPVPREQLADFKASTSNLLALLEEAEADTRLAMLDSD
ncbi:MAG: peptidoglycan DD-metalloendopeptidase family protein [Ectothiorhodospiraceae bacterium]|nr:peptidoglycan DD-metalloendopeptidase family protein [Ectothiorhodospiraceae bacterium]